MDASLLPPLARMFLVAIWIESLLYGANCVLFIGCMWVLGSRLRQVHPLLLASTVLLFSMSTAHIALSLVQLLQAFLDPTITMTPHGADLYFINEANAVYTAKNMLYNINVFAQDFLLIWRLYMVWGRNWRLCILPLIVETIHITAILIAAVLLTKPGADVFGHAIQAWGLSGWALDVTVNTSVTFGIAYRLWQAERNTTETYPKRSGRMAAMFTVLESGAIFAGATIVLFGLDAAGNAAGNVGISPVSQLATMTPLLIIVRVGMASAARTQESTFGSASIQVAGSRQTRHIEVSIQQTADISHDYPADYPMKVFTPVDGKSSNSLEDGPLDHGSKVQ